MQDITPKKVDLFDETETAPVPASYAEPASHHQSHHRISSISSLKDTFSVRAAKVVEKIIDSTGKYFNIITQALDRRPHQAVIQPSRQILSPVVTAVVAHSASSLKRKTPARRLHITLPNITFSVAPLRRAATTAAQELKTPLGKLALVQMVAIIALFVTVFTYRPSHSTTNTTETATTGTQTDGRIHRYLPQSTTYTTPTPFTEQLASIPQQISRQAWVTPWNTDGIGQHASSYTSISAFWLTLSPDTVNMQTKADWQTWDNYLTNHKVADQVYWATVTGDPDITYQMISDPAKRAQHITNLLQVVRDHSFDGIDIDYEGLGAENSGVFTEFIRNLTNTFHAEHKKVSVTVEARIANQVPMDWYALGQLADQVRIMAYDYHAISTGLPGPIAPLGWVQEVAEYASHNIPAEKLVIGLGNYGYDWTKQDDGTWKGTGIGYDQAIALANEKKIVISRATGIDDRGYDIGSIPMYTYTDTSGHDHAVWFEDAQSMQEKINVVTQYSTSGIIFWSVGLGDDKLWKK